MILHDVACFPGQTPLNIQIEGERITHVGRHESNGDGPHFYFSGNAALPGLINSHDHLDFNCYPVFGGKTYRNYIEWGREIHKLYKEEILAVQNLPRALRISWGIYKNLLAGVTTVVNHGELLPFDNDPLITIIQRMQNLHSVGFEKNWKWKLNFPWYKNKRCVIHTGEGTDPVSVSEIDDLIRFNFMRRKLIGVHAVAMNAAQAKHFSGLVWCPESNRILLASQPDIPNLRKSAPVVFGTDSTLTGDWNIWHHLRFARSLNVVDDTALLNMVTCDAAKLWNLNSGSLEPGKDADILIMRAGATRHVSVFNFNPEDISMIIQKGRIRLFDHSLLSQLVDAGLCVKNFSPVQYRDNCKYVAGNLPEIIHVLRQLNPAIQFPLTETVTSKSFSHAACN